MGEEIEIRHHGAIEWEGNILFLNGMEETLHYHFVGGAHTPLLDAVVDIANTLEF